MRFMEAFGYMWFIAFSAVVVWGSFAIELGYFVNSITHKEQIKELP
jgi:hypothetical protein